jgi:hypothetical protein
MPIRFHCPGCGIGYEVDDDLAGKAILCRECQHRGQVANPMVQNRRRILMVAVAALAAGGSITTGALLARRPWRSWGPKPERRTEGQDTGRRGGGRGKRGRAAPDGGNPP